MVLHPKTKQRLQEIEKEFNVKSEDSTLLERANTRLYENFMAAVAAENLKVNEEITAVYRAESKGKEWIFYNMNKRAVTKIGMDIACYVPHVGKYWIPIVRKRIVPDPKSPTGTRLQGEFDGTTTEFEIEWTKENLKKLSKNYAENVKFYIVDDNQRYGLGREEFENADRALIVGPQRIALQEELRRTEARRRDASGGRV
jgi:hypothetical protein